jgi:pilus assembly protein CpaB
MTTKVRLAIAAVCALAAAGLVAWYTANVRGEAAEQRREALERYGGETASVYVSSRDIAAGEALGERNLEVREWLVDLLPDGALTEGFDLTDAVASSAIAANTPLSLTNLEAQAEALEVPAGLVAVTVPATVDSAVGGAVGAGSVVDLYAVGNASAYLLEADVAVLQTSSQGTAAKLSWATVALDPSHVEAVLTAAATQKLYLVLPSEDLLGTLRAAENPDDAAGAGDAGAQVAEVQDGGAQDGGAQDGGAQPDAGGGDAGPEAGGGEGA